MLAAAIVADVEVDTMRATVLVVIAEAAVVVVTAVVVEVAVVAAVAVIVVLVVVIAVAEIIAPLLYQYSYLYFLNKTSKITKCK